MERYLDRSQAGQLLAQQLTQFAKQLDAIVLGLPRGGIPVAYEVACALSLPLDVFIVRKLGAPGHVELAVGAIANDGVMVLNEELIQLLGISQTSLAAVIHSEQEELKRREFLYRGNRVSPQFKDKTIILVDDGIATGATMMAAVKALRQKEPKRIVVASPVAARDICNELAHYADEVICPYTPTHFQAVSLWYQFFDQTSDAEVTELLKKG